MAIDPEKAENKSQRIYRRLRFRLLFLPLLAVAFLYGLSSMEEKPKSIGVVNGQLYPLPQTPNCVSTQAGDDPRNMPALEYTGGFDAARKRLLETIAQTPRLRVVTDDGDYLHAEATSLIFRFVDDVEFLIDDQQKRIHFRSASRVGHSDLGANRRRMEQFSKAFSSK